jgi:tRNA A-37 threonylcarbamoyl transferase component Bud32
MDTHWRLMPRYSGGSTAQAFADLNRVFALAGDEMARDSISHVVRVQIGQTRYFVKRYEAGGKQVRRYVGPSRVRTEWENLLYFEELGIPTAPVVGYGQEYRLGRFKRGALITEELKETEDLASLAHRGFEKFNDPHWLRNVSAQLAGHTLTLHEQGFIHTDLKWRNILVNTQGNPHVYLIDCPSGRRVPGLLLERGITKDLACLDKVAKRQLSRTQRMRFYLQYAQRHRTTQADRKRIRRILRFFDNRE